MQSNRFWLKLLNIMLNTHTHTQIFRSVVCWSSKFSRSKHIYKSALDFLSLSLSLLIGLSIPDSESFHRWNYKMETHRISLAIDWRMHFRNAIAFGMWKFNETKCETYAAHICRRHVFVHKFVCTVQTAEVEWVRAFSRCIDNNTAIYMHLLVRNLRASSI